MKRISIIIVILAVLLFALFYLFKNKEAAFIPQEAHAKTEAYIRARISELSPAKEVLGGKFYVTDVIFLDDTNGIVKYEDGHMAYTADFVYKVTGDSVQVSSFKIEPGSQLTQYRISDAGISFAYPSVYRLEKEADGTIVLVDSKVRIVSGGEGPISITISQYSKSAEQDLEDWIKTVPASNYNLQGRDLRKMNLAGKDAYRYSHSGLYEADAVVFVAKNGKVAIMTVTYTTEQDQIRADFEDILKTIVFF